jgi:hypothetical protein
VDTNADHLGAWRLDQHGNHAANRAASASTGPDRRPIGMPRCATP